LAVGFRGNTMNVLVDPAAQPVLLPLNITIPSGGHHGGHRQHPGGPA
jgi:hypothetical protein